jgi:hypothetical protein
MAFGGQQGPKSLTLSGF